MRLRRLIILSLVLLCSNSAWAKVTTLTGVEASYAGKKMVLQRYLDGMVGMSATLDSCVVDSSGKFIFSVDIASPIQVYIPSEVVNSFIFLEPGQNYEVKIPAFQERTLAQKLDPYYRPADILAEIKGLKITDFNYKMMEFEDAFDFYSMKNLVYGSKTDSILESINQMKEIFNDLYADPFQGKYMEYRFLLLMNTSPNIYQDSVIVRLNNLGVDADNPAFWDIFNNLFENFIPQQNVERDYAIFRRLIEEGNVKFFFMHLNQRYGITDKDLVELVAIKLMCDLLNQPQFEQMKVVEMLQGIGAGIASQQNRDLLSYVINYASSNFIGAPAQDFVMLDMDGKERNLSDFFGKFIYLNFGNSALSQTQKDMEVLLRFQNTYGKELVILNVGLHDSLEQLQRLSARYSKKMEFFVAKEPDKVKQLYSVKSVPAFFLIDKDGKLLMTKGAEPTDELRMLFQKIFKSE